MFCLEGGGLGSRGKRGEGRRVPPVSKSRARGAFALMTRHGTADESFVAPTGRCYVRGPFDSAGWHGNTAAEPKAAASPE